MPGPLRVSVINHGEDNYTIEKDDCVAYMMLVKISTPVVMFLHDQNDLRQEHYDQLTPGAFEWCMYHGYNDVTVNAGYIRPMPVDNNNDNDGVPKPA